MRCLVELGFGCSLVSIGLSLFWQFGGHTSDSMCLHVLAWESCVACSSDRPDRGCFRSDVSMGFDSPWTMNMEPALAMSLTLAGRLMMIQSRMMEISLVLYMDLGRGFGRGPCSMVGFVAETAGRIHPRSLNRSLLAGQGGKIVLPWCVEDLHRLHVQNQILSGNWFQSFGFSLGLFGSLLNKIHLAVRLNSTYVVSLMIRHVKYRCLFFSLIAGFFLLHDAQSMLEFVQVH